MSLPAGVIDSLELRLDSYVVANNQYSLLSENLLFLETLTCNATLQLRYFQFTHTDVEPFGPFQNPVYSKVFP